MMLSVSSSDAILKLTRIRAWSTNVQISPKSKTLTMNSKIKQNNYISVPVHNISVTGRTWLQIGEYLHLNYSFQGSLPVEQCIDVYTGKFLKDFKTYAVF